MGRTARLAALALLVAACGGRGPGLDRLAPDALFQRGMEALAERDWSDAVAAFERYVLVHASEPRAAEARYRLGEAYMGRGDYITAALELNRLASDFPAGPWADDARFKVCESYEELAPGPQLHQEYTRSAIDHCQALVAYYPDSEYVERARQIVERMTARLAEKDYRVGEHYFRLRGYEAANVYYQAVVANYPTTPWAPRALMRMYEGYRELRYDDEAQATRERLLREYPSSAEARQLNALGAAADTARAAR